ncbi:MAG: hypothetical protein P4L33_18260 [Capsulimonadaceae bacterium]|nr:hypothetical protein [Capsulimonadaceae bacterium]
MKFEAPCNEHDVPIARPTRLRTILAVAYLLAVTLISYGPALAPSNTFLPADLLLLRAPYKQHVAQLDPGFTQVARPVTDPLFQFYPSRKFLRDSLREGTLPLWNPLSLSGTPFAADDQSAIFYPPNWLFAILPLAPAFGWLAALHTFLTGLFFWAWSMRLGRGDLGSLSGATVWMLCGVMVSWQMWQVVDDTLCWLPLALYFWEAYRSSRSLRDLGGVAVALALTLLAGHLQFGFYVWLTVFCYALYRPAGQGWRRIAAVIAPFALGAGLGFVQVATTADMLLRSLRANVSYDAMVKTAMPLKQLVLLVAPALLGGQRDDALTSLFGPLRYDLGGAIPFDHAPFVGDVNLYELTCYCGASALVFAAFGFIGFRNRGYLSRLWLGLAVFALLMGCGSPLFELFYNYVPLFKSFHGAARILVLVDFCVAALCASGIEHMGDFDRGLRRSLALKAFGVVAVVTLIGFRLATTLHTSVGDAGYLLTHDWMNNGHVARALLVPLAFAAVAALFAAFGPAKARVLLPALVAADMLLFACGFNAGAPARLLFPATPETQYISDHLAPGDRVLCLANVRGDYQSRLMPNSAMALGWPDISGNDPLVLARYDLFMRGVNKAQTGEEYPAGLGLVTAPGCAALDLIDLRYVIAPASPPSQFRLDATPNFTLAYSGDVNVYVNKNARAPAWLAEQVNIRSGDEALADLLNPRGMAALPDGCVLDRAPDIVLRRIPSPAPRIAVTSRGGTFDEHLSGDPSGLLLVTDTIYEPGWRAIVDGRPARTYLADGLVAATDAGRHVTLRYLPAPVQFGLYVTLFSFLILLAALAAHCCPSSNMATARVGR